MFLKFRNGENPKFRVLLTFFPYFRYVKQYKNRGNKQKEYLPSVYITQQKRSICKQNEGKDEKPDYYDIALALIPNRIKHEVSYYRNGKRGDKDYPNENIAYYPEKNKHK